MANNIAVKVTADVADLTAKMAVAKATMQDTGKTMRDVARQVAAGDGSAETKTRLLEVSDAYSKASASAALYAREQKALAMSGQTVAGLSGQQKFALVDLGRQLNDVSTMYAMGAHASQIFASQSGQVIDAIQMMGGEGSKFSAFLGGPWGIAITTAAAVLLPLAGNLLAVKDATSEALDKLTQDAQKTEETRAAKAEFAKTEEGVSQAIREQGEALAKQAEGLKTEAERSYEAARANREHELQVRRTTQALLEQAMANEVSINRAAASPMSIGAAEGGGAQTFANQANQRVRDIQARLDVSNAKLKTAEQQLTTARSNLDVETGKRMADPVEQVRRKYEGAGGLIEQARKRAVAEGKTGEALQQQVAALAAQQRTEMDGARKEVRASRGGGGRSKGPDQVSVWAEQLHAQEIASGEFFKDQTANELAFWQAKLALTARGSKDWLAVQSRIYEAAKTLARQDYQDHIADLNQRIAADRNDWTRQQADWQEKLAFIKGKFGEQSAEYKNAYREFEQAQREHDDREFAEATRHGQRMTEQLRRSLDSQARLRDEDARIAETVLRANAGGSAGGEVRAAIQIGKLHEQVTQQKLADLETLHAAESASMDGLIAEARAKYGEDVARYQSLLDQKLAADQAYADRKAELDSQMRVQSMQDIMAVRQAYHGYIDGVVGASTSATVGMLSGTMTWSQGVRGVYSALLSTVTGVLQKMVTNWIVEHLLMGAVQKTGAAAGVAAHVTAEGAKTAATATAASARAAAEVGAQAAAFAATRPIALAQAASLVGLAGAGGVASMAAAPFPIDLGAPAFGAAMAAAAAGYASLASFDKGTNLLGADMIAQVHAGERIVPAADNARLIELTARGAGASNDNAGKGDMHVHYNPTINGHLPFKAQLSAHEDAIVGILKRARRRGAI